MSGPGAGRMPALRDRAIFVIVSADPGPAGCRGSEIAQSPSSLAWAASGGRLWRDRYQAILRSDRPSALSGRQDGDGLIAAHGVEGVEGVCAADAGREQPAWVSDRDVLAAEYCHAVGI